MPRMHGEPLAMVEIRQSNTDFKVFEIPPCDPDGTGEHVWVLVRKDGCNTDWVAEQLAKIAEVSPRNVSYAGRKDRHAVCEQWFSVHLPGLETPSFDTGIQGFEVLSQARHSRKLRTGALKGNRFEIVMRPTEGEFSPSDLAARLERIQSKGVPNYFGPQRFGRDMSNLIQVERWAEGRPLPRSRNRRSMTISAARSWIFNLVVAGRLRKNECDRMVRGDFCRVTGRHSGFFVDEVSPEQIEQLSSKEIEIAAPLVGEGFPNELLERYIDLAAETYVLQWCNQLSGMRISTEWRAITLFPEDIETRLNNDGSLFISFQLPPGAFATSIIREIANLTD